jgi:hypothetical protein
MDAGATPGEDAATGASAGVAVGAEAFTGKDIGTGAAAGWMGADSEATPARRASIISVPGATMTGDSTRFPSFTKNFLRLIGSITWEDGESTSAALLPALRSTIVTFSGPWFRFLFALARFAGT